MTQSERFREVGKPFVKAEHRMDLISRLASDETVFNVNGDLIGDPQTSDSDVLRMGTGKEAKDVKEGDTGKEAKDAKEGDTKGHHFTFGRTDDFVDAELRQLETVPTELLERKAVI